MSQRISDQVDDVGADRQADFRSARAKLLVETMDDLPFPNRRRPPCVVFLFIGLCALTVYVVFLFVLPHRWAQNEATDYIFIYEPVAHNIAGGRGCVNSDGSFATRYPPGYPLMLAALFAAAGNNKSLEALLSHALIGFSVIFSALSMLAFAGLVFDDSVSMAAAMLCATYPFFLWLAKQPNSEIPFLLFFLPSMLLFFKCILSDKASCRLAFAAGALVGLASLIRPITIALTIVLALGVWVFGPKWTRRQQAIFSCTLLVGNLLLVLPWEVFAREKTGHWILLSTGGPPGIVDGLTFAVSPTNGHTHVSPELRAFMEATAQNKEQLQSVGAIAKYLARQFVSRPSALFQLVLLKMVRSWYATDRQSLEYWILLLQLPYLLLAGLGVYKGVRIGGAQGKFTAFILLVVGYFWLMTITSLSIVRYMVPAMMLLMPFVAVSVTSTTDVVLRLRTRFVPIQPSSST